MPKGVIIQGSTGSGKTTLGRPVAPKLGIVTCNIDRKTILHCVIAIIIFLIIPCLISGCSATVSLDEETQAKLDEDTVHAMEDALQYLSEKYDMDFELKSFEPIISSSTNEDPFVRTEYYGEWEGEFTVYGETYNISGYIPDSRYADTYQLEEIQSAYTELMQKYFVDICEEDGIVCKAKVLNGKAPNRYVDEVLISVYYDGTNLYDCLKENGIEIDIDITDAGFSEELLRLCEKSVAEFEKDYEGAGFRVIIIEGEEKMLYTSTNYARFDYDKWINSEYYGIEGITLCSLNEYIISEKLYIYKYSLEREK